MPELLQEYWYLILAALVIGVVVAWWVFHASRRTRVELEDKAADEGGAKRNQALIDSPPVAATREPVPEPTLADAKVAATPDTASVPVAETAPEPAAAPATATEAATAPAASPDDDLRRIKGVGPKLVTMLAEQGITSFAQIAAWDDGEIDRIDAQLGRFQGRIRRDDWVAQARLLAADDITGYEDRFGKV